MKNNYNQVSLKSKDILLFESRTKLLKDLKSGIDALRKDSLSKPSDTKYIYLNHEESVDSFEKRVRYHTDLINTTEKSINNITDKTFEKNAKIDSENNYLLSLNKNIDLKGTSFSNFLKCSMKEGIWFGKSYIFTDYNSNLKRSYSQLIDSSNIRDVRYDEDTQRIILFKIETSERVFIDDFSEEDILVTYVYKDDLLGNVTYSKYYNSDLKEDIINKKMDIEQLPISEFYAETTIYGTNPDLPFYSMADKNIVHFRSNSQQLYITNFARIPFLYMAGFNEKECQIKFGSDVAMSSSRPEAKIAWVESNGSGIAVGEKEIDRLERQLEAMGQSMLIESTTATAAILTNSETRTRGSSMASNMKDTAMSIIRFHKMWMSIKEDETEVYVNTSVKTSLSDVEFNILIQMKNLGAISNKTLRQQAKERGLLGENWTEELELDNLNEEGNFNFDINKTDFVDFEDKDSNKEEDVNNDNK